MKVLLVGNYENNRQQSMARFGEMMRRELTSIGHEVRLVRPPTFMGNLRRSDVGVGKWIGYIDRFMLYPPLLIRQARWADVVHICDQANSVYIPYLRGKPHVLTCHDMLAIRSARGEIPESTTGPTGRIYQHWILRNLRRTQMAACVSQHTLEETKRVAGLADGRLVVVPNALNFPYRPMLADEAGQCLRSIGLEPRQPFFLHVGGNQWYKNRPGVLRLFAELAKHRRYGAHNLVMAGKAWTAQMRKLVVSLGLKGRVIEQVNVSSEQLCALYSTAEALLFPSLQEGFGWPIVEAQACGCPVATSNRRPMTDVGGNAAVYVDPTDVSKAATQIARALLEERERFCNAGLKNAARYSITAMIEKYVHCYSRVLAPGASANNSLRHYQA